METKKSKDDMTWFIDCDPGCDDAVALALLAWKLPEDTDVEVLSVAGNVVVDLTTWNASRTIAACRKKWPVYRGCGSSLSGESVPASSVHGRDGLGDIPNNAFDIAPQEPEAESAVRRYMVLSETEESFILVCTGPLTNLASALNLMSSERQIHFWSRCVFCVVMGGAFDSHGNITSSAEFNFHFDPVAVHLVLQSWRRASKSQTDESKPDLRPIHFVPLDVTELVGVPLHSATDEIEEKFTSPATPFLRAALRKYGNFHARNCARPRGKSGSPKFGILDLNERTYLRDRVIGKSGLKSLGAFCYLHDPLAMWMALQRNEKKFNEWWAESYVDIDLTHGPGRGQLIKHDLKRVMTTPLRSGPLGTRVLWLDPRCYKASERRRFVAQIKKLLNFKVEKKTANEAKNEVSC